MRRTALCAALAAAFAPAWAQQQDPEITALTKPESEVSVGAGYWTKDRPRLGTYDGMNQMGLYGLLDALIRTRDDAGTWFTLDMRNFGLETRELRADWLRQGNMGAFFEYGRTPRDEPRTVLTAVQGIGSTTLRVPTPSATTLNEMRLGTVREAFAAGFSKLVGREFEFRVNAKTEDKTGERLWGRGGAPEFAAEPIDSNISQLEALFAYTTKVFQVQGGYYGSWYKNRNSLVDTANINAAGVTPTRSSSACRSTTRRTSCTSTAAIASRNTRERRSRRPTHAPRRTSRSRSARASRYLPARRRISMAASTTRCCRPDSRRARAVRFPGSPTCATTSPTKRRRRCASSRPPRPARPAWTTRRSASRR